MKTVVAIAAGLVAASISTAHAEPDAREARTFEVAYTEIANSCEGTGTGINLTKAKMSIAPAGKGRGITVEVELMPIMTGRAGKNGKFSARAKKSKTAIEGLDGKFSVAGNVADGDKVEVMLIAEFYRGPTPLCTTSWKGEGGPPKAKKPAKAAIK